jgi:hypothetical protein
MILRPDSAQDEADEALMEFLRREKLARQAQPSSAPSPIPEGWNEESWAEYQAQQRHRKNQRRPLLVPKDSTTEAPVHPLEQLRLDSLSGRAGFGHTVTERVESDGLEYQVVFPPNRESVKKASASPVSTSSPDPKTVK